MFDPWNAALASNRLTMTRVGAVRNDATANQPFVAAPGNIWYSGGATRLALYRPYVLVPALPANSTWMVNVALLDTVACQRWMSCWSVRTLIDSPTPFKYPCRVPLFTTTWGERSAAEAEPANAANAINPMI